MYSETLLDHFLHPRNVGFMKDANGVGTGGDPSCGDYVRIFIRVDGPKIAKASFQVQGCPSAIATASVFVEAIIGMTLKEAWEISDPEVVSAVGGLPEEKIHCSNLAVTAFQQAVIDHLIRAGELTEQDLIDEPPAED